MDYGHKQAERNLINLEKQMNSVYKQAYSEVKKKTDAYFKRFEDEDKKKAQEVKDGTISESEYTSWRQSRMLTGARYKGMLNTLAETMTSANQKATSMTNDSTKMTFAENYNYGAYEVSKQMDTMISFELVDKNTVDKLVKENTVHLPRGRVYISKDKRWNRQKMNSAITQGILQGDSIDKIAKRLQKVTNMNRSAAIRNARTLTTGAENGGRLERYKEAQEMGIEIMKKWEATLDNVTRDSHVDVDGEVQEIDKPFSNGLDYPGAMGPPEEVYNCFIADTEVAVDSEILRGYKHWYDGEVISIKTASGVNFTCTPNHPILTPNGWIKANLLNNGQNLLVTSAVNLHDFRRNPHINHVFTRFDALFELLEKVGGKWTSALGMNFHGDISTSDVEIISKKGFLRSHRNTINGEKVDKFLFKSTNSTSMSNRTLVEHFRRIWFSTLGFIRRFSKPLTFFERGMCHSKIHSIGATSRYDTLFFKAMNNNCSSDSELFCKSLDRLARVVFTDKIVDIKINSFHGYVYNLQTDDNYYFVNSILSNNGIFAIAHNCRCTMVSEIKGHKYSDKERFKALGNMSYEQWKNERGSHGKDKKG